jgi:hypothetical protein
MVTKTNWRTNELREANLCTAVVTRQQHRSTVAYNGIGSVNTSQLQRIPMQQEALLETVFSTWSVQRGYKEDNWDNQVNSVREAVNKRDN